MIQGWRRTRRTVATRRLSPSAIGPSEDTPALRTSWPTTPSSTLPRIGITAGIGYTPTGTSDGASGVGGGGGRGDGAPARGGGPLGGAVGRSGEVCPFFAGVG